MIRLYKGVEIDSSYNIVYDVSSDASFLSYLSKYLKQSITEDFNFLWVTSTTATITVDNGSLDIEDCLNFNYLVYENNYKYYYFFITKAECNSNQSTTFTLSLDVWSTYGYRELANVNPTIYVDRAHCKRFNSKDSIHYTLPQFLTPEAGTQQRNSVDTVELFGTKSYLLVQVAYSSSDWGSPTANPTDVRYPTLCFIAPLTSGSTIQGDSITQTSFSAEGLYKVAKNTDIQIEMGTANFKGTVVSISVITLPLLSTTRVVVPYTNEYVNGIGAKLSIITDGEVSSTIYTYCMYVVEFYKQYEIDSTNLSYCAFKVISYPTSATALSLWDKKVEPKLLSYPFSSFNFIDYNKQYSEHNLFKVFANNNVIEIYHYNGIGAGTYQDFMCFNSTHPFYGFNKEYGIGEISNYGDSLGHGTDSYAEWCRNNSTAAQTSLALGVVGGAIGLVGGALMTATGNPLGLGGVIGGVTSIAGSAAKYEATKTDVANARETFSQPSSNLYFSMLFNKNLIHGYQIKTIGEEDRNLVSSYFYYNGYAYNSTEAFLTAISTRCMFNYLKSSDPLIKSSIKESEDVKNKILEILSKGTEIWSLAFLTDNSKTIAESRGIYANYEKDIL